MAKIKLTKTELKTQQDALKQYRRYLPTLQIKKQQLQQEIRLSRERLEENLRERERLLLRVQRRVREQLREPHL